MIHRKSPRPVFRIITNSIGEINLLKQQWQNLIRYVLQIFTRISTNIVLLSTLLSEFVRTTIESLIFFPVFKLKQFIVSFSERIELITDTEVIRQRMSVILTKQFPGAGRDN